jgi:surface protein
MFSSTYENAACGDLVFDEQGGSDVADVTDYKLGFALPALPTSTLSGDSFLGWSTNQSGCIANAPTSMSVDPTNLYAQWQSNCELAITVEPAGTDLTVNLPIGSVGCYLNVTIDWGDGTSVDLDISSMSVPGDFPTKTYSTDGTYEISVTPLSNNTCSSYGSDDATVLATNPLITGVSSLPPWVSDYSNAFSGATNLTSVPSTLPSSVTDVSGMFNGATSFNQDLSGWVTTNITDMSDMFNGASSFNQDIGDWDTSAVTDMSGMFFDAAAFNQNLSDWDVSDVTDFSQMFDATNDETVLGYCLGWTIPSGADVQDMFGSSYDSSACSVIEFEVGDGSAVSSFEYQATGYDLPTPPDSTKAGSSLLGWSLSAADCQPATFPMAGPIANPTKLYAVWSDCVVASPAGSQPGYSGPIVSSVGGQTGTFETQIGARVRLNIENPGNVTEVYVNGVFAEVTVNQGSEVIFIVPEGVEVGVHDITIVSDNGRMSMLDAIGIKDLTTAAESASAICATQGVTVWTKRLSDTLAKAYIKCAEVGTSYRIQVQRNGVGDYKTIYTRTPNSEADDRQVFNDFGRYFIRSIELGTKTRIRILSDGNRIWKVVYNLRPEAR